MSIITANKVMKESTALAMEKQKKRFAKRRNGSKGCGVTVSMVTKSNKAVRLARKMNTREKIDQLGVAA